MAPSTPLVGASDDASWPGVRKSDPEAVRRAFDVSDWSLPKESLTENASGSIENLGVDDVHERARSALTRLGFGVVEAERPTFDPKHPLGSGSHPAYGYLVAEAGLRLAQAEADRAKRNMIRAGIVGIALLGVGLGLVALGVQAAGPALALFGLLIGALGALIYLLGQGMFDSQIVSVQYWGRAPPAAAGAPTAVLDAKTPCHVEVKIHVGEVRTVNRPGGRGSPAARQFRAVLQADPRLVGIGQDVLETIRTGSD